MVSGLPGQIRKKAAKVGISVCRDQAGEVSTQFLFLPVIISFPILPIKFHLFVFAG